MLSFFNNKSQNCIPRAYILHNVCKLIKKCERDADQYVLFESLEASLEPNLIEITITYFTKFFLHIYKF